MGHRSILLLSNIWVRWGEHSHVMVPSGWPALTFTSSLPLKGSFTQPLFSLNLETTQLQQTLAINNAEFNATKKTDARQHECLVAPYRANRTLPDKI